MHTRLPELLAEHLGTRPEQPRILALASDVRDEIGELTHLGQADPDALADLIRRHTPRPVEATATQCTATCGECSATCFLPKGHDLPRHCCQAHFL
ncbi:hypothetical protein [Actinomadura sp. CNU-125]|uniref:hypothetical protein n=1 Tax=Actinomadura sp. CNU-125 TaxID=1904961 RepID=UPI0011784A64|nr:hypothetical protein [Actinomadura sp. CNU-125]